MWVAGLAVARGSEPNARYRSTPLQGAEKLEGRPGSAPSRSPRRRPAQSAKSWAGAGVSGGDLDPGLRPTSPARAASPSTRRWPRSWSRAPRTTTSTSTTASSPPARCAVSCLNRRPIACAAKSPRPRSPPATRVVTATARDQCSTFEPAGARRTKCTASLPGTPVANCISEGRTSSFWPKAAAHLHLHPR